MFLSFIPVIGLIGIILLLIGMKGLSEYYRDESIYKHAFKGLLFGIIGIIAVSVLSVTSFFSFFTIAPAVGVLATVGAVVITIVLLIVAFIFYLLMAMNFRRAFNTLAERSGENNFRTAGTLLYWGAVLTIIFVGLILIWISWIILALAFFSMKPAPAQPLPYSYQQPQTAAPPPTMQGTRYCPTCGSPVDANATFCPHCGKQLPPP